MKRILITNGDHAANALAAHFPDAEILIWRDVLIEGPVPGGIGDEALADIRAQHIESAFGMSDVRADFTRRNEAFSRISKSDAIELWFETDLHDQLQLLELLPRLAKIGFSTPPVLALCPPPLSSHIDDAAKNMRAITQADCADAALMWAAFRSSSPEALPGYAREGATLPEARAALGRLLEEYPSARDGLGRIERGALIAVRDGAITPGLAFRHYQQSEQLPFLGDLGFYFRLDALGKGSSPLLNGLPLNGIADASRSNATVEYMHAPIELTEAGHSVLEGRSDHIALNGIDRWIGGVHLQTDNLWRFDRETRKLLRG